MYEVGVFLSSPANSTMFTNCCKCAITDSQSVCPSCEKDVIGCDANSNGERQKIRWAFAYKGPKHQH